MLILFNTCQDFRGGGGTGWLIFKPRIMLFGKHAEKAGLKVILRKRRSCYEYMKYPVDKGLVDKSQ
jgi:hypothetical protein